MAAELPSTVNPRSFEALEPGFAQKVKTVFAQLSAQGYQPIIGSGWRSLDEQAKLKAEGKSQVSFSFHNNVDSAGRAAALAVDVVDKRYGWKVTTENVAFLKAMGAAAEGQGLTWGGGSSFKKSNPVWAKYGLGWDPAHIQALSNSALSEVRKQSQAAWAALKGIAGGGTSLSVLPSLVTSGYLEVLKRLPWWYWTTLGVGAVVLLVLFVKRRRTARAV